MTGPLSDEEVIALDERQLSPATRIPFIPTVFRDGKGAELVDGSGRRFIDFHSMACITNTGQCHPRVVAAINEQASQIMHCNLAYAMNATATRLASELVRITPGTHAKRVSFGLSGSDANDGGMKLARAATGRPNVIAFSGSYHGNTYGALSLSAVSLAMRRGFGPLVPGIYHVPFPDVYRRPPGWSISDVAAAGLEAIERVLETVTPPEEVAAVVVEPIQGDSGILIPPPEWVAGLRRLCSEHGIALVADEVQTGMGRTGAWFASEHDGLDPDVVLVGKALASGMPVSAIVARAELMERWSAPGHVFSTGGNPVCCAAGLATIGVIEEEQLVEGAASKGDYLRARISELAADREVIGDIRGRGLMVGIDLVRDRDTKARAGELAAKVILRCHEQGLFLTFLGGNVLRLVPPLVITREQIDRAVEIIAQALDDALAGRVSGEAVAAITGW